MPPWSRELEDDDEDEDVVVEVEALDERVEEDGHARRRQFIEKSSRATSRRASRASTLPTRRRSPSPASCTRDCSAASSSTPEAPWITAPMAWCIGDPNRRWDPLVEGDVLCSQNALGKLHGLRANDAASRSEDVISNSRCRAAR